VCVCVCVCGCVYEREREEEDKKCIQDSSRKPEGKRLLGIFKSRGKNIIKTDMK